MTSEEQSFLQAIIDNPEDDGLRLIFADWLEERGDPRADFIRVQIALAEMPPVDPRRGAHEAREQQLLDQHAKAWHPLPDQTLYGDRVGFRRGFYDELIVDVHADLARLAEAYAWTPVRVFYVSVANDADRAREVAQWTFLQRCRRLDLTGRFAGYADEDVFVPLFRSPNLAGVEELISRDNSLNPFEGRALLASPFLDGLRELQISTYNVPMQLLMDLIQCPRLAQLQTFHVQGAFGNEVAQTLSEFGAWKSLRSLILRRSTLEGRGMLALSQGQRLGELQELDLSYNPLTQSGVEALFRSSHLRALERLNLGHNRCVGKGAMSLFPSWPAKPPLKSLNLAESPLGGSGAKALANADFLCELRHLDLTGCQLGYEGAEALSLSAHLRHVQELHLGDNQLTADVVWDLLGAPRDRPLLSLDLSNNSFGDKGVLALTDDPYLSDLVDLKLGGNAIGEKGVEALVTSRHLGNVRRLDLSRASLDNHAIETLCRSDFVKQLSYLDLSGNNDTKDVLPTILALADNAGLRDLCWGYDLTTKERRELEDCFQRRWRPDDEEIPF